MSGEAGHDLLQLTVELSPAGMLVVDDTGKILLVNREIERVFGYAGGELVGQSVEVLIPERLRAGHPALRAHYLADPVGRSMGVGRELYGLRKDGTEVPVEIGLTPIDTGQRVLVLAAVVDISGRRAIEKRLVRAQRMETMGLFAGGIAHDFNNLLHGITGHAELARRRTRDDPQVRADLDAIIKVADRGRRLVERILTFSRERELTRTPIRVQHPLREALDLLRAILPRTVEIRESLDPDASQVVCDETEIHQIVMNLAANSAQAMEQRGRLELSLTRYEASEASPRTHPGVCPGLHVRITVVDTGPGMPADVLEHAFEPFFTTKPPGQGTGLGLSVVYGIVKSLGGMIEISSTPGQGTRVDVYLPAAGGAKPTQTEATIRTPPKTLPHVLAVEDEKDFAVMLRRQLEAFEFRATVHTSSTEALADFRARPQEFDVLMTDNSMPEMSGLILAQEVRRIRPDLPVILVSGAAAAADPDLVQASGIAGVLRKPHTGREMDRALRAVLGPSAEEPK